MGWTGEILNGVGGFTKIAANGAGDLQMALGTTSMSQIELCTHANINQIAKYKPFKNANISFASFASRNAARAAARYGMTEPTYFYPNAYTIPAAWSYDKPVSGVNPLRAQDFIKDDTTENAGYDPNAVPPLALEIPGGLKVAATFVTMLWKDSYVNNYLAERSSKKWWADRSLSIEELLGGGQNNYNEYWVSFVFYRYNAAGTSIEDATLVATNKKFGSFSGVEVFRFYPQGDGTQSGDYIEDGIHYPVIPMLQSTTYVGRKFAILACLSNTGPSNPTSYAYQVLPNNYSCIPLGFDASNRWDYAIVTASSEKSIDMLTGKFNTGPVLTLVRQHEGGWNEYSCSAWVTADITSAAGWAGTTAVVNLKASAPGGMFGGLPGSGSEYGEYIQNVSISVPSGAHTNTKQLIQLPNVFIYKDAPHTVVVNGKFTQTGNEKAFNNSLTISD